MAEPRIRTLTLRDTDRILDIDARVSRVPRRTVDNDLWRLIAETTTCFGADQDGKLVGFVLADVRPWEFGARAPVGWIIALGVDPAYQKRGIGRELGDRVVSEFRRLGVSELKTLVDAKDQDLQEYFKSLGFKEGRDVVLEMSGGRKPAGPATRRKPVRVQRR